MNARQLVLTVELALVASGAVASDRGGVSDGSRVVFTDPSGDATLRRTDSTLTATLPSVVPDLLELTVGGWATTTPTTNPYAGSWVSGATADLMRIDLVVGGLVNPPGTISPFEPAKFGSRPLVAFVEFDADGSVDTGGECDTDKARTRYLAHVGRFGALPPGVLGSRAAQNSSAYNTNYSSAPQFERSGADFVLSLCGCVSTTVVDRFGDTSPSTFDAGETWIVRGRYFQRTGGYIGPSAMFGGTAPGAFDPLVNLRYSHDTSTDRTTISLVFPVTNVGAAALAGAQVQQVDTSVSNHTSLEEAILDIVDSVDFAIAGCERDLIQGWSANDVAGALDPSTWDARALIGVPYLEHLAFSYAYTDVGFDETVADLNADGVVNADDRSAFFAWLNANDGTSADADGAVNGSFSIASFGPNFQLHDFNNSGVVNDSDASFLPAPTCPGDVNGDLVVNFLDLNAVLSAFGQTGIGLSADLDFNGVVDFLDFNLVLSFLGIPCD